MHHNICLFLILYLFYAQKGKKILCHCMSCVLFLWGIEIDVTLWTLSWRMLSRVWERMKWNDISFIDDSVVLSGFLDVNTISAQVDLCWSWFLACRWYSLCARPAVLKSVINASVWCSSEPAPVWWDWIMGLVGSVIWLHQMWRSDMLFLNICCVCITRKCDLSSLLASIVLLY